MGSMLADLTDGLSGLDDDVNDSPFGGMTVVLVVAIEVEPVRIKAKVNVGAVVGIAVAVAVAVAAALVASWRRWVRAWLRGGGGGGNRGERGGEDCSTLNDV